MGGLEQMGGLEYITHGHCKEQHREADYPYIVNKQQGKGNYSCSANY